MRTSGTTSTFYYYDGLTVIAEKQKVGAGNWDWQRIFTVAPGVIGNIFRISEKSGETWSDAYYHYDAIGNVALRTNGYGSVLESLDQEAYGNVKVGSQAGYHLTTKEYDTIPELYYFCNRWYDSSINFTNKDPLPNIKPYLFCINNPNKYIDPTGLEDTLSCLSYSYRELINDTGWYFVKRIIKWERSWTGGGRATGLCWCHLIANNWRNIYARKLLWKMTNEIICHFGGECSEGKTTRSKKEEFIEETLNKYIDIPMQHPMRITVMGVPAEGGCFSFWPSQ